MRFFTESDVRRLLPMRAAIRQMRLAFEELGKGTGINQPRRRLILPTGAVLHQMAGAFGPYFGTKIYSTHPRGGAHFLFVLYAAEDGKPLALFEANRLGQIRTGAASGYATDLLAPAGARTLALIGTGFQARSQLEAALCVRRFREVRVWSRTPEKRERFAERCVAPDVAVRPAGSAQEAVEGADAIVTATNARAPVLEDAWVKPGAHINAVGSNDPRRRELPAELVRRAELVVVDSLEQARLESGDLLMALDEAGWSRVRELQDAPARPSPEAITVFKSHGLGVEDVAAAAYVYESAGEDIARLPVFHS